MKKLGFISAILVIFIMTSAEAFAQWTINTSTANQLNAKSVTVVNDMASAEFGNYGLIYYATDKGVFARGTTGTTYNILSKTVDKNITHAANSTGALSVYFSYPNIAFTHTKNTTVSSDKYIDISNKVGSIKGIVAVANNELIVAGSQGLMRCLWNHSLQKWQHGILNNLNITAAYQLDDNNILLASSTGTCLKVNKNSLDAATNFNTGLPSGTRIYRFIKFNNKIYAKTLSGDDFYAATFYVLNGTTWVKVANKIHGLNYVNYNSKLYHVTAIYETAGKAYAATKKDGGAAGVELFVRDINNIPVTPRATTKVKTPTKTPTKTPSKR